MISVAAGVVLFVLSFVCEMVSFRIFMRRLAAVNERLEPTERPFHYLVWHHAKWIRFEKAYKRLCADLRLKRAESIYGAVGVIAFLAGLFLVGYRPF